MDSGKPCSLHQSPFAWKIGTSFGLHFVHTASRTPCSLHRASDEGGPDAGAGFSGGEPCPHAPRSARTSAIQECFITLPILLRGSLELQVGVALPAVRLGQAVLLAPV